MTVPGVPYDRQAVALPAADAAGPDPGVLPAGLPSSGMSDTNLPQWLADTLTFVTTYRQPLLLTAGTIAVLVGGIVLWQWFRRGSAHERTSLLAVALATGFAAEGMFEVARQALNLPIPLALVLFAMFEVVMLNQALLAKHKMSQNPPKDAHWHIYAVWGVAGLSGIVASLNSENAAEFALRIAAPIVAAGVWWMSLMADQQPVRRKGGSWRWTPRRIGLALGLLEPSERDIETVHREARIQQMTELRFAQLTTASVRRQARLLRKLKLLSLTADDAMIAEVQANVVRAGWPERDDAQPGTAAGHVPAATPGRVPAELSAARPGKLPAPNPGSRPDTEPGIGADNSRAPGRTRTRARKPSPAQVRARKLKADRPDMTWAQLAKRVGANERTVRRWFEQDAEDALTLPLTTPAVPVTAGVNGREYPTPATSEES